MNEYFHGGKALSHNAIFNAFISNRGYGKTWGFKKRAWVRARKKHRKTVWVRRFKKEAQSAAESFFSSIDLLNYIGSIEMYNPETKQGNCRQVGKTFYIKHGRKWEWFLKIVALSDTNALRSADDVKVDTIVFDEFTTTPYMYTRYRGNEVQDFCDMFFSLKREHEVRVIFLGNNESAASPYFSYFGIKPLPMKFEGIRKYRHGAFLIQKINNKPRENKAYDRGIRHLFSGTTYGDYIYKDTYRTGGKLQCIKPPPDVALFVQLNWRDVEIAVKTDGYHYFCVSKIDETQPVYCDEYKHAYVRERLLVKKQKPLFAALISAFADNRVYYDTQAAFEAMLPFRQWLGC